MCFRVRQAKLHQFLTHAKTPTQSATLCILGVRGIGQAILTIFSFGNCRGQPKSHPHRRGWPVDTRRTPSSIYSSKGRSLKTGPPSCLAEGPTTSGRAMLLHLLGNGSSPHHRYWGKGSRWICESGLRMSNTSFPCEVCKHQSEPSRSRRSLPYLAKV